MSGWARKRIWKTVSVHAAPEGFGIALDDKPLVTPLKVPLYVPSEDFAHEVAAEWDAVDKVLDPTVMHYTRAANAAIDKVAVQRAEVVEMLAAYGESDLLCYRAGAPEALVARQAQMWDPLLDWAVTITGERLAVTTGVIPIAQPATAIAAMQQRLDAMDIFQLTGAHDLIALSGSLVLPLGVIDGHIEADHAWEVSRLDEVWQAEQWGQDEEAEEAAEIKRQAFVRAARIYALSTPE